MITIDLIYGDSIENMKLLEDKSIDFVLCDLPFGITAPKWAFAVNTKLV